MVFIEEMLRDKIPAKGNLSLFEIADFFGIDLATFRGRSAVVEKETGAPGDTSLRVFFKIYSYRKSRWQRFLRRPRTWREVRNLKFFASTGIFVPDILGWGELRTWWGKVEYDFIITKAVPSSLPLREFFATHCPDPAKPEDAAIRRNIIAQIARGARVIHDRNFFHQDLKWRNLLVSSGAGEGSPVVFWIDCPSGYFDVLGRKRKHGRIKDMATMDKVARELCSFRERMYFLRIYLGRTATLRGVIELAREVERYARKRFGDSGAHRGIWREDSAKRVTQWQGGTAMMDRKGGRTVYVAPALKEVLAYNEIRSFEDLWSLKAEWFEPPNSRRGGWSGVSRIVLGCPGGGCVSLFLKRQENHTFRPWYGPWKKELTFLREYRNLLKFQRAGIPTQELVYFGQTAGVEKRRAILITRELAGYRSLDKWMEQWEEEGWPSGSMRGQIAVNLAKAVQRLHRGRWVHRCLYPKHIFLRIEANEIDVRFIDLEKARQRLFHHSGMISDLGSLYRRSRAWPLRDRILFLREYFDVEMLRRREKKIWKILSE